MHVDGMTGERLTLDVPRQRIKEGIIRESNGYISKTS